jgi:hypothetical protein
VYARRNQEAITTILRQRDRDQPRAKLDELADSMVVMALKNPSTVDSGRFAVAARALADAGARGRTGKPYTGALDRLIRVHKGYPSNLPGHSRVVEQMLMLDDHDRAVEYVARISTSSDPSARYAMGALIDDLRTAGRFTGSTASEREALLARLHALWDRVKTQPYLAGGRGSVGTETIPDPGALATLQVFAREQNWPR